MVSSLSQGVPEYGLISRTQKATRAHTRAHNKTFILKTIYDNEPISRAEASRVTHLTRATVSNVVAELIGDGLVVESGIGEKTIGKPPTLLNINANAGHLLCLDLAGSQFCGCIQDLRGRILHQERIQLADRHGDEALELVYVLADKLMAKAHRPLLGIGVGTPGVVDPRRGVTNAINLNWIDLPLGSLLEKRYNLPAYLANDAQVAALAQYLFGNGEQARNLILVKVGQGIGAGIVLDGKIFYGDGFGAGEIGHVVVAPDGELCTCGHFGCLETMAGSRALANHVSRIAMSSPGTWLHPHVKRGEPLTTSLILEAHRHGDLSIRPVIERSGRYLGQAIAHLIGALNLRHIYIAGTMARFEDALLEPIRQEVARCALPALAGRLQIRNSGLSGNIVILGAAALVLHHELGLV